MTKTTEATIPSPCISLCALDENDICLGCQRSGQEISNWGRMDNQQKREVLALATARAQNQGLTLSAPSTS